MIDTPKYTHDVFISYSHRDATWVVEELQPQLEAAGLTVLLDKKDFAYGEFAAQSMDKAVRSTRHFVAVVTEDWLNSPWCQYEQWLQFTKDPIGQTSRFIALVFVTHDQLPDLLRGVNYADCTTFEERGHAISQVLLQLECTQQEIDRINADFTEKGLGELKMLMKTSEVRKACEDFSESLHEIRTQIKQLFDLKLLHDYFQRAEDHFKLAFKELRLVKAEVSDWDDLDSAADLLNRELQRLLLHAESFLPASERTWAERLTLAQERLVKGIRKKDAEYLSRPMEWFGDSFGREPLRLNDKLFVIASRLDLPQLIGVLQSVANRVRQVEFDEDARTQLSTFERSLIALQILTNSLHTLVTYHNILQGLDGELRRYNFLAGVTRLPVDDIVDEWQIFKEITAKLNGQTTPKPLWLKSVEGIRDDLSEQCVPVTEVIVELSSQKVIRKQFNGFNNAVTEGLTCVDTDLKKLCERLQSVGNRLGEFFGDAENG